MCEALIDTITASSILERDAPDLGGASVVCIGGLSKPLREAAHPRDYRRVIVLREEFRRRRTVLK